MPLPITNECNFEQRWIAFTHFSIHVTQTCQLFSSKAFLNFFFISRRVFHPGSLSLKAIICDPVSSIEESIRHLRDESSCVVVGIEQFSGLLRVVKLSKRWSRILPDVCAVLPDRQDVSVVGLTG